MAETARIIEADRYEEACHHAIETCGGDPRSAVKSLLIVIEYLEHELELAQGAMSLGYRRGRAPKVTRAELAQEVATDRIHKAEEIMTTGWLGD